MVRDIHFCGKIPIPLYKSALVAYTYTQPYPVYWQQSQIFPHTVVPSIIPPVLPSQPPLNIPCGPPYQIQSPTSYATPISYRPIPEYISRVSTPPLSDCRHCSAHYICPHHFHISPLAAHFCCHYCYIVHTFSSRSSKRWKFYRS